MRRRSRANPSPDAYHRYAVRDAKRLHALEEENRRLKRLVADPALNLQVLKDVLAKVW